VTYDKCRECGSKENLVIDKKDNAVLCKKCFQYRLLKEDCESGNEYALALMNILKRYYPQNVNQQKNLMMAIFEMIDNAEPTIYKGQKTVEIKADKMMEIAKKWQVSEAILMEMLTAELPSLFFPTNSGVAG